MTQQDTGTRQDTGRHNRTIERRHMIRAKDALAQGLGRLDADRCGNLRFVTACVDYLEFIVGRFIRQGLGNVERLRTAVPAADSDNRKILEDIDSTLNACREQLDRLTVARRDSEQAFIAACSGFLQFYNDTLAQRKDPAQAIVQAYFDPETYWRETDDVTPESIETERSLFARLIALAPEGIQIDADV